jgi:mitogen-activated protein kinase 7
MGDLAGRKVFKVFNQDFVVDDRYTVTKELGQGAYGIVWYDTNHSWMLCQSRADQAQVRPQTRRREKEWPSRKSPMFSAKRSWPSALCERSSSFSTFADIEMWVVCVDIATLEGCG